MSLDMLLSGCLINKQRMVCMFLRYRIFPGGFSNTVIPGATIVGKSNAALAPDCLFFFFFFFPKDPYLTCAFRLYFIDAFFHSGVFWFYV